jgi:DNA polymerase-4
MRVILHADMDAFYASVEQRDRPELRGRPVIVGGTGERGVVAAASYEARRFGVRSAIPTAQARALCPEGVFLRGDMRRYARESERIFEIFGRFTPLVEGLSLDEAFLDLTGTGRLHGPPSEAGRKLRALVRAERELAISVGIAPVKMVAKIASELAKPDGLLEVAPDGVRAFLEPLPAERLWGVGPVARERLARLGVHTIGDLAGADPRSLERALGSFGAAVSRLARGEDLREVESYREAVSYGEENTFERDVVDREVLESALRSHAEAVARRLRRDGVRGRVVVVKLKLGRRRAPGPRGYPLLTRRTTLVEASDDGAAIARAACELLARATCELLARADSELLARATCELLARAGPPEPVRLVGVSVSGLEPAQAGQLGLFAPAAERGRRDRLNRALDELTERFGPDAVRPVGTGDVSRAGLSLARKRGADPRTR